MCMCAWGVSLCACVCVCGGGGHHHTISTHQHTVSTHQHGRATGAAGGTQVGLPTWATLCRCVVEVFVLTVRRCLAHFLETVCSCVYMAVYNNTQTHTKAYTQRRQVTCKHTDIQACPDPQARTHTHTHHHHHYHHHHHDHTHTHSHTHIHTHTPPANRLSSPALKTVLAAFRGWLCAPACRLRAAVGLSMRWYRSCGSVESAVFPNAAAMIRGRGPILS